MNGFHAGRRKITDLLIRNGAYVNVMNIYGETPLHWTAINSYEQIADLLIKNGADVDALTVKKRTPLHWAAINGL